MPEKNDEIIEKVKELCIKHYEITEGDISFVPLTKGCSGAFVLHVEINNARDSSKIGHYVLKIAEDNRYDDKGIFVETLNTININTYVDEHSPIRIPAYEYSEAFSINNTQYIFYLYSFIQTDLNNAVNISSDMKGNHTLLETLSKELLCTWNSSFSSKSVSLHDCMVAMLGERLLETNERIFSRIQNLLGDALCPYFKCDNEVYPNPYFFFLQNDGKLSRKISGLTGRIHGDLNRNNIIAIKSVFSKKLEIYLIDFSHYKENAYLFYDQAYLLFDLLSEVKSSVMLHDWVKEVGALIRRDKDFEGHHLLVGEYIFKGVEQFVTQKQINNKENCHMQFFVALVVAGFNWLHKNGLPENKQYMSFMLSAIALRELLTLLEEPIPDDVDTVLGIREESKEKKIWTTVGGFDVNNSRYMLISSFDKDGVQRYQPIGYIKWNCVFDLTPLVRSFAEEVLLPTVKKISGLQYVSFPSEKKQAYEVARSWCHIQVPSGEKYSIWYRKNLQQNVHNMLVKNCCIEEGNPIYIFVDVRIDYAGIVENIIGDIIAIADPARVVVIPLSGTQLNIRDCDVFPLDVTLVDVSNCIAMCSSAQEDTYSVKLPNKDGGTIVLSDEDVANISTDFEIIHDGLMNTEGDAGEAFYHGAEPSWQDIAIHRDVDRVDYETKWKDEITADLRKLGLNVSKLRSLFHSAGSGGTTLSKRILWDFHKKYPCLAMKRLNESTDERLKLLYNKTKLPILITVELTALGIALSDINDLRKRLINKGVRSFFIPISRISHKNSDTSIKKDSMVLPDTPNMLMSQEDCEILYKVFASKVTNQKVLENLNKLTYSVDEDWRGLRQPFFYGLFTYEENYTNINGFIDKGLKNISPQLYRLIVMLSFMTAYSQIGLTSKDVQKAFDIKVDDENFRWNPLIVSKTTGYQICHQIIAEKIFNKYITNDSNLSICNYIVKFIDTMLDLYSEESVRLNEVFENIFTRREYIESNEQRANFSALINDLSYNDRIKVFNHLINSIPSNPHFYNHFARVYLYSNDQKIDFKHAEEMARNAIAVAELKNDEGTEIHHHLLGKVYSRRCVSKMRRNSSFSVRQIWNPIESDYEIAVQEFQRSIFNTNVEYGLIAQMQLIADILNNISDSQRMTISDILKHDVDSKPIIAKLISDMQEVSSRYLDSLDKIETENALYNHLLTKFKKTLGDYDGIKALLNLQSMKLRERLFARRALVEIESLKRDSLFDLPQSSLKRMFELINENVNESSSPSQSDLSLRWKLYLLQEDFDLWQAYSYLESWIDGDTNYHVCFYRYVISFLLYLTGTMNMDYMKVQSHLKQSQKIAQSIYGKSIKETREFVGVENSDGSSFLVSNGYGSELSKLQTADEKIQYRNKHCKRFVGTIENIEDSLMVIKFSNDNRHLFKAKMPISERFSISDIGKSVSFVLGFSYSELRAWDVNLFE